MIPLRGICETAPAYRPVGYAVGASACSSHSAGVHLFGIERQREREGLCPCPRWSRTRSRRRAARPAAFGDAQAQAGAADLVAQWVVGAEEWGENMALGVGRDAHAGVAHIDTQAAAAVAQRYVPCPPIGVYLQALPTRLTGDLAAGAGDRP